MAQKISKIKLVVIGISAGGLETLHKLFSEIDGSFPIPIIIVQHRMVSDISLPDLLQKSSKLKVLEAEDKQSITQGNIYIAPADFHVLVDKNTIYLSLEEHYNSARPSIDVLFETAADAYKESLLGIIMTGFGYDGVKGLKVIVEKGGMAIAQNPDDAIEPTLPSNAIMTVKNCNIMTVKEIAEFLNSIF